MGSKDLRRRLSAPTGLYDAMYRVGYTPWEHPGEAWTSSLAHWLDLEEAERDRPLGRALDVGCGRGRHVPELVRRGWEVVGIDYAPRAIDEARARCIDGATFVVGDVTDLPIDQLGTFSFFFDIGCFQHLDGGQRSTAGRGITALATPAAPRPPLDAGTAVTPGDPTAWALHRRLPRLAPRPGYLRAPAACAHHVPETGCG